MKIEIDIEEIAVKLQENLGKDPYENWTYGLIDALEDLYGLETRLSDLIYGGNKKIYSDRVLNWNTSKESINLGD